MKKIITTLVFSLLLSQSFATSWTFFNGTTGWHYVNSQGYITINNYIDTIDNLGCYPINRRMWYDLGKTLNSYFYLNFDVTITDMPNAAGGAFIPFVVTSDTLDPHKTDYMSRFTNQDAFGVSMCTSYWDRNTMHINPFLKNDTNDRSIGGCSIILNNFMSTYLNTKLHIEIERLNEKSGRLSVYQFVSGELRLIASKCFTIPEGIRGLKNMQVANWVSGDSSRRISGRCEKVALSEFVPSPCCSKVITGPNTACGNGIYAVVDNSNAPFTWILPAGASGVMNSGTDSININWGDLTGEQTIWVKWQCNCEWDSVSYIVYLTSSLEPWADFKYQYEENHEGYYSPIGCGPVNWDPLPPNTAVMWQIYKAKSCDESDTEIVGGPLRPAGTEYNFWSVFSPDPPYLNIDADSCYVLVHRIYYTNSDCYAEQRYKVPGHAGKKSLGIPGGDEPEKVILYPNPAESVLHIQTSDDFAVREVNVINIDGTSLIRKEIHGGEKSTELRIEHLNSGSYIVRITTTNNVIFNKKFIKK